MVYGSTYEEEIPDLGDCCACGRGGKSVKNLVALEYQTLTPGKGWGCVVCNIPSDGAIAVVCDDCLERLLKNENIIKHAIYGYATEKKRCDIKTLKEPFRHLHIPH